MFIANNIYSSEQGLLGSRCQNCKEYFFPQVSSCANCSQQTLQTTGLGHRGQLWSWTIQRFLPKAPYASGESKENFTPYGVGLIEMDCGLIIKTRIGLSENPLEIGQAMELHITSFNEHDDGAVETFEFRQAGSA